MLNGKPVIEFITRIDMTQAMPTAEFERYLCVLGGGTMEMHTHIALLLSAVTCRFLAIPALKLKIYEKH